MSIEAGPLFKEALLDQATADRPLLASSAQVGVAASSHTTRCGHRWTRPTETPFHRLPSLGSYSGGKSSDGTFQKIINEIPPHITYVEGFLGGGGVLRHKRHALHNVAFDTDPRVVRAWREEGPKWLRVERADAFARLPSYFGPGTFLFLDPPYQRELVPTFRDYPTFSYEQQQQLLEMVRHQTAPRIMLCSLPSLLYDNMLKGWRTLQYSNQTRRGPQIEQLWMNYDAPAELHDYRYVGTDHRERAAFKRSMHRNLARMQGWTIHQRRAFIEALTATLP